MSENYASMTVLCCGSIAGKRWLMNFKRLSSDVLWAQAESGSDLVFPSAHGGATLVFKRAGWPDETFSLWLPENLHALGTHALKLREQTWKQDAGKNSIECSGESYLPDGSSLFAYRAGIHPVENGLRLVFDMQNLTSRVLIDPWVNICLKLAHAPSFADPELTRTYVRIRERWNTVASVASLDWREQYRIILLSESQDSVLEHLSQSNVMTDEPADHSVVAVVDTTGRRSIGFYSPDAAVLVVNGREHVRCVHSNPRAHPYRVAPNGECSSVSFLLFVDGPLEELTSAMDHSFLRATS